MNETQLLKRLQLLKKRPDIAKEMTPTELAQLVVVVLGYAKEINKQIEAGKLKGADGVTPKPDKDYLSLRSTQKQIEQAVTSAFQKMQKDVRAIKKGQDGYTPVKGIDYFDGEHGKNAELTPELLQAVAVEASKLVDVPSFKKVIEAYPDVIVQALKTLPDSQKLTITDIQGLERELESLDNQLKTLQTSAGVGGTSKNLINKTIEEQLGNVDNTSDADKPISTATQTALNTKQATLVSGTNIKTINETTMLGSGNFFFNEDPIVKILTTLGGTVGTLGIGGIRTGATIALTDNQLRLTAVYIPETATITGVKLLMNTQGSYTSDNNNKIGFYSYSGGTLTLVASSADDGNLWKASANTIITKAFSSPYSASAGVYFVGVLYNSSAQVTAPALASGTVAIAINTMLTNSAFVVGTVAGQNDLPASFAASTGTAILNPFFLMLY